MKKADLSPGLEVAVKHYGDAYRRGIVVDTTGWSDRFYASRLDPEKVVVLEDGKQHNISGFSRGGRHVLVEVFEKHLGSDQAQPRLRAVALQNILGIYAEHQVRMDEVKRLRREQVEQQRTESAKIEARQQEVRDRLMLFVINHERPAKPHGSTIRVSVDQLEALLDAAERGD